MSPQASGPERKGNALDQELADDLRSALGQIEDILGDLDRRVARRVDRET